MKFTENIILMSTMGFIAGMALMAWIQGCGTESQDRDDRSVYLEGESEDGANCFDTAGDTNGDGILSVADCIGETGAAGEAGAGCTVRAVEDGALVSCGEDEVLVRHGAEGEKGDTGDKGEVGEKGDRGKAGRVETETLIYQGYACNRTIVSLGKTWYVIHGALVPINDNWIKISSTCSVRYNVKKKKLETK
jgi:hypothetical protein